MLEALVWIFYVFVTCLVGLVTAAVIYARRNYGVLENTKGLKHTIKPYFMGGSDPFFYSSICCDDDTSNVKKYGKVFGMYDGDFPTIFVSDPDMIRDIFIKDFDHFRDRRFLDGGHELITETMDLLPYDKWKVVRNQLSPQLTTGKIRSMSYQMQDAINEWVSRLQTKADGKNYKFAPKDVYTALTADVIARCAFGTKINVLDNPDDKFLKYLKSLSLEDQEPNFMFAIGMTFPFLGKLIPFFPKEVMDFFGDLLKSIMAARRSSGQERVNDFVDALNDMLEKCSTDEEYKKLGITETTVVCQAMVFMIAGFETTATTLTLMSHYLSMNPHIQDKLIEEIDSYLERHEGKITHETIGELTYLHAVMQETLRMHPQLIRLERSCVKDWFYEPEGLLIKKGITIQVPVNAMHYDEKNFENPFEFKPERFLGENKNRINPYTILSFGIGPHNCIGMRFAKEEIQMTMASLLRDFKFANPDGSKLTLKKGRNFLNNYEPFTLELVQRKK